MPDLKRDKLKITDTEQYRKLIQMLKSRYYEEKTEEGKKCTLCGKQSVHLLQMSNGLSICEDCKNSEVTSIGMAAELLYTTYGNFKRLFPHTRFRYPNLEFSQQSMHQIRDIAHGRPDMSGLLEVVNDKNDGFSLRIVRDIPYGFLEELYAQAFSQQLDRDTQYHIGTDRRWTDYMKEYLENAGRWQQLQLLP